MRAVLKRSSGLDLTLTPSPRNTYKESYPSYHIKGIYKSRCGRTGYQVPYQPGGYKALMAWAITVILGEEGEAVAVNDDAVRVPAPDTCRTVGGETPPACTEWRRNPMYRLSDQKWWR